jgi:adhesin/invasin
MMRTGFFERHELAALGGVLSCALLAGCGETSVNQPLPAAQVQPVGGATITGTAGALLADPIEVVVLGSDNQPLPGAEVTFSASAGGTVDPASASTDRNGSARTRWKFGNTAGTQVLTASAGSGISATVTATVGAARPANVTLVAGNNQTAPAGSATPVAPSVRVADAFGNLVANAIVTFSVLSGGGRVTDGVRTTNTQGVATVGSWILGSSTGTQTLAARVEESGVSNNPIIFTATAGPPTGTTMVATAGDNQSASVGVLVPVAPTVQVRNGAGDGVAGVVVTFTVASGGGAVVGSRQVTDATGTATVGGWFLGPLPGVNTLTASAPGIPSVTFTATGGAGIAVTMAAVSQTAQSAPVGSNVPDPPAVIVRDAQGIPVPGVVVTFAVTAGGGTVVGSPATTGANGVAALTSWKLGPAVGPNTVTATAAGLNSVTFNATGGAGSPATVVAFAGDNQTAVQGTAVATPPAVRVTDTSGNPVIGLAVTFAVTAGGGSATGLSQLTDTQGRATVGSWTLGSGAPNTLTATVAGTGITGNPIVFNAQSATQIAVTTQPTTATVNVPFTITVQLRNSAGAAVPLPGVPLTIAVASGGGTLAGTLTRVTDGSGVVTFNDLTMATTGSRTFTISGAGLIAATTGTITF